MKKYRFLSLLLLLPLLFSLSPVSASALEDPDPFCTNAVLVDAKHGEVLYDKKAYEKAYPASITKVMTALLVMEAIEAGRLTPETMVTASAEASWESLHWEASTAYIRTGETLSVKDLLHCLLLPSANEAANILAEAVDGTIPDFVDHMNRRAGELGCRGTHFVNPNGLHDDEHYSTAYDITRFMAAALEYDLFREVIGTARYIVPATNMSGEREFFNTNALISNLHRIGYVYDKCIGGKTGTTSQAGSCLAAAAEDADQDELLISVLLGSGDVTLEDGTTKRGQFLESARLLQWGFDSFERVTITRGDQPVAKVGVTLSRQADEVMVKPQGSIVRTLPVDMDLEEIKSEITLFSQEVEAPVEAGQVMGTMKLSYEGEVYGTLDLVAVTSVERSELLYKKEQFIAFFQASWQQMALGACFFLAAAVLLRVLVFRKKRRYHAGVGTQKRSNYRGTRR